MVLVGKRAASVPGVRVALDLEKIYAAGISNIFWYHYSFWNNVLFLNNESSREHLQEHVTDSTVTRFSFFHVHMLTDVDMRK